ncbi:DMT family transporter [Cellulosilyticum sp. I15G10I2]|uniref:DMT family transporter n=1 Tax=Cellulosilyticum sp. I15G10I2 TaxID=1892843 RepID=UPI00085CBB63|nr:DMT family transporter [Cellulosilyticum sp. I15G10I2]
MNIFISAFIGVLIAIMLLFNGTLSQAIGNYTSSVLIHITGLFAVILILLIGKLKIKFTSQIPLHLYSAGGIGVLTVLFSNLSFSLLGASLTLALSLLGQSLASILIDHFGILEMTVVKFEKKKLVGLLFIILGIFIMAVF